MDSGLDKCVFLNILYVLFAQFIFLGFRGNGMTEKEKITRLSATYQKLPLEGRDVVDRMIGKLAKVHRTVVRYVPHTGVKQSAEQDVRLML